MILFQYYEKITQIKKQGKNYKRVPNRKTKTKNKFQIEKEKIPTRIRKRKLFQLEKGKYSN